MKMDTKKWYASKTLWTNAVMMAGIIAQGITGREILSPEIQGLVLGMVNVALRLITKSEVVW